MEFLNFMGDKHPFLLTMCVVGIIYFSYGLVYWGDKK